MVSGYVVERGGGGEFGGSYVSEDKYISMPNYRIGMEG